jgi:hypothetical protein
MVQHFPAPTEQISHSLRCMRPSIVLQNRQWVLQKVLLLLSQSWLQVFIQKINTNAAH